MQLGSKVQYHGRSQVPFMCTLQAYSLISNRGRSQNFQNLNFLHVFVALLLKAHLPKGIRLKSFLFEMRAITENFVHKTLFKYGSNETHIIMHIMKS